MKDNKQTIAYNLIKERIFNEAYASGSFLQEQLLCEELGMGRTPIREALQKLVTEGILESIPKRGIFIPELNLNDVIELYDLQKVNQGLAAALCAGYQDPHLIEKLKEVIKKETALKKQENVFEMYRKLIWEFDDLITQYCRNERLKEHLFRISEITKRIKPKLTNNNTNYRENIDLQKEIVKAIETGDAEAAEKAVRKLWDQRKSHWFNFYATGKWE